MSVTQLFSIESSFYNSYWNFALQKVLRCLPKTSLYLASPISRGTSSFIDKTIEGFQSSFISSICFNVGTNFFCRHVQLIYQTSMPVCKIAATSFDRRRWTEASVCSPFSEETLKCLLNKDPSYKRHSFSPSSSRNQPLHHASRHVSMMATVASRKTHQDAIMISRCQGDDTFVAFQPMWILNGNSLFSKDVYSWVAPSRN